MPDSSNNSSPDLGAIIASQMEGQQPIDRDCEVFDANYRSRLDLTCVARRYDPSRVSAQETNLSGLTFEFSGDENFLMPIQSSTPFIRFDNTTWISNNRSFRYIERAWLPGSSWIGVWFGSSFMFWDSNLDSSVWSFNMPPSQTIMQWESTSVDGAIFYGSQSCGHFSSVDSVSETSSVMRFDQVTGSLTFNGCFPQTIVALTGIEASSLYLRQAGFNFLSIHNAAINRVEITDTTIDGFHFSNAPSDGDLLIERSSITCDPFDYNYIQMTNGGQALLYDIRVTECPTIRFNNFKQVWIEKVTLTDSRIRMQGQSETVFVINSSFNSSGLLPGNLSMPMLSGVNTDRLVIKNTRFSCEQRPCEIPLISAIQTSELTMNNVVFDNLALANWTAARDSKGASPKLRIKDVELTGDTVILSDLSWACAQKIAPCLPEKVSINPETSLSVSCAGAGFFKPAARLMTALATTGIGALPTCPMNNDQPSSFEQPYDQRMLVLLVIVAAGILGSFALSFFHCYWKDNPEQKSDENNRDTYCEP